MRKLYENASKEEIIDTINKIIALNNAFILTIINFSKENKNVYFEKRIDDLEKKIIQQGDLIVACRETIDNQNNDKQKK